LRQSAYLHVAKAVIGEARLEPFLFLAFPVEYKAFLLKASARVRMAVVEVERTVLVKRFVIVAYDGLPPFPFDVQLNPSRHVFAEIN
jgi:hypothetical protein